MKHEISERIFSFYLTFLISIHTFIHSMFNKHICDVLLILPPLLVEKLRHNDERHEFRFKGLGYELMKLVVQSSYSYYAKEIQCLSLCQEPPVPREIPTLSTIMMSSQWLHSIGELLSHSGTDPAIVTKRKRT